jgi:hypothetical protein
MMVKKIAKLGEMLKEVRRARLHAAAASVYGRCRRHASPQGGGPERRRALSISRCCCAYCGSGAGDRRTMSCAMDIALVWPIRICEYFRTAARARALEFFLQRGGGVPARHAPRDAPPPQYAYSSS